MTTMKISANVELGAHNIANILCTKYLNDLDVKLHGSDSTDDLVTIKKVTDYYDIVYHEAYSKLERYDTMED